MLNFFRSLVLIGLLLVTNIANLDIVLSNYGSTQGQLVVSLFESPATFLVEPLQTAIITPIPTETAAVRFDQLPTGDIAIAAFHDVNANGELDTGLFGIPTEVFVFGNNARGTFGPPSFQSAAIALEGGDNTHRVSF
ncbi:MAG: DUF2141 domain-containing protein [Cyanobacteria bacterium P01_A01_bin.123]